MLNKSTGKISENSINILEVMAQFLFYISIFLVVIFIGLNLAISQYWKVKPDEISLLTSIKQLLLGVTTEAVSALLIFILSYIFLKGFQRIKELHLIELISNTVVVRIGELKPVTPEPNAIISSEELQERSTVVRALLRELVRELKKSNNSLDVISYDNLRPLVTINALTFLDMTDLVNYIESLKSI